MKWESAARTDTGRVRSGNEDAFLVRDEVGLFAIADGMGGHAAGEVASGLAIETLARIATEPVRDAADDAALRAVLEEGVRRANAAIVARAERDRACAGMGTTLTALALTARGVAVFTHVGDSRAYLLHGDSLGRLTRDHSWVQEQIDAGALAPEVARQHPFANVLTQALGTRGALRIDGGAQALEAGDRVLLCSDGLTTMLDDDDIRAALAADSAAAASARLVDLANERGGYDNVTVVVIDALD